MYDALLRLPKGWYAWHSLALSHKGEGDAEADFVIADPQRGLIVLEVKSGAWTISGGLWHQSGHPEEKDPYHQVRRTERILRKRLEETCGYTSPSDWLFVFPDSWQRDSPTKDEVRKQAITGPQVSNLMGRLSKIFAQQKFGVPENDRTRWLRALHEMWCETWVPSLKDLAQADADQIKLDDEQHRALVDGLLRNPVFMIEGSAGTGKTVLAVEAARRVARNGKRVLMLCFTEALAKWLKVEFRQAGDKVQVWPVKRFAIDLLRQAGVRAESPSHSEFGTEAVREFFERVVPDALDKAGDLIRGFPVEVIIVDEAQDLDANDWKLVEELARAKEHCWIFCDPEQTLWPDRGVPRNRFPSWPLFKRYRCHPAVQALADLTLGKEADKTLIHRGVTEGRIKLVPCRNREEIEVAIGAEIRQLTNQDLQRQHIAVLSLVSTRSADCTIASHEAGPYKLALADEERGEGRKEHVTGDSAVRFKGLEREAVIVTDLSGVERSESKNRLYVALTRARSLLRIVDTENAIKHEPAFRWLL